MNALSIFVHSLLLKLVMSLAGKRTRKTTVSEGEEAPPTEASLAPPATPEVAAPTEPAPAEETAVKELRLQRKRKVVKTEAVETTPSDAVPPPPAAAEKEEMPFIVVASRANGPLPLVGYFKSPPPLPGATDVSDWPAWIAAHGGFVVSKDHILHVESPTRPPATSPPMTLEQAGALIDRLNDAPYTPAVSRRPDQYPAPSQYDDMSAGHDSAPAHDPFA